MLIEQIGIHSRLAQEAYINARMAIYRIRESKTYNERICRVKEGFSSCNALECDTKIIFSLLNVKKGKRVVLQHVL